MNNKIEIRPGRTIHISNYHHPHSQETVFLFHGLGGSGRQWREQIDLLKSKYSLVIPDLLGHGQSDKPKPDATNPYSFAELEADIQAIFAKYESHKNLIIGHSYGGALALVLAANHQDRVSHLTLISPTPCTPKLQIPRIYHLPTWLMELLRPLLDKQFQALAFDRTANPTLLAQELQAAKENPMYVIKALVNGMESIPLIDIATLTIPTLIITGEHDGIIPPAAQQGFYQAMPHHQFQMIKNASHMVMLEKPQQVNEIILRFIENKETLFV